jgi:hypothetical protein
MHLTPNNSVVSLLKIDAHPAARWRDCAFASAHAC